MKLCTIIFTHSIQCDYNGILCSSSNFTWFITASFGFCYTFNAKLKNVDNGGIRYNADNGGYDLLELRLYTHQHLYVPYVSFGKYRGVLFIPEIFLHVQVDTQLPAVELGGMLFGPGHHHRLSYSKKKNLFLSAPYTMCNDKINLGMQAMLDKYNGTGYEYSQYQCFIPCIQAYA